MAKPTKPASFDKTTLDPTYEALYDKAAFVIPLWENAGSTPEELKTGELGSIIDGPGDGLGPNWGSDAEGVYLEWPGDQNTTGGGRWVEWTGPAMSGNTYDDLTLYAVVRPESGITDDGVIVSLNTAQSTNATDIAITDDANFVGYARGATSNPTYTPVYGNVSITDASVHTVIGRRSGTNIEVASDNVSFNVVDSGETASFTNDYGVILGDNVNNSEQFKGRVYAVYAFDTPLTNAEIQSLNTNPYGIIGGTPTVTGTMMGVSDTEVAVSVQMKHNSIDVRLNLYSDSGHTSLAAQSPVVTVTESGSVRFARLHVSGLTPDTTYYGRIEANGVEVTGHDLVITTQGTGPRNLSIAFGNCNVTGSNNAVFSRIETRNPDMFLHAGDIHYKDGTSTDPTFYLGAFDQNFQAPNQVSLYQSVPMTYTPDDHGFPTNDSDANTTGLAAAQESVRVATPHINLADSPSASQGPIYWSRVVGRVRIISMDIRSERDAVPGQIMSTAQMNWIKSELDAADLAGQLPVLISSVPWITQTNPTTDDWSGYSTERDEIADKVISLGIDGIVVCGDMHGLAADDGTNNTYGTTGQMGWPVVIGGSLDQGTSLKGGPYTEGSYTAGTGNHGLLEITDNGLGTITARVRGFDETNTAQYDLTYTATVPIPFGISLTNPTATPTSAVSADATVDTDTPSGTLWAVIQDSSVSAPTDVQVKNGLNGNGATAADSATKSVTSTGTQSVSFTGLSAATNYQVYSYQED